jgi:hypothetical protein
MVEITFSRPLTATERGGAVWQRRLTPVEIVGDSFNIYQVK